MWFKASPDPPSRQAVVSQFGLRAQCPAAELGYYTEVRCISKAPIMSTANRTSEAAHRPIPAYAA